MALWLQVRDRLELLLNWRGAVFLAWMAGGFYIIFWSGWLASLVLGALSLVLVLASGWVVLGLVSGYGPATAAQRDTVVAGSLWHVTRDETAFDTCTRSVELSAERCRFRSRVLSRDKPWKPSTKAVFVFAGGRPRSGQIAANVSGRSRAWLLELDGQSVRTVLVRGDGAIALPDGFTGKLLGVSQLSG